MILKSEARVLTTLDSNHNSTWLFELSYDLRVYFFHYAIKCIENAKKLGDSKRILRGRYRKIMEMI